MAKRKINSELTTSHKNGDFIEFIDENDRHTFCNGIVAMLRDKEIQKKIREKEAKCKASFSLNISIPEFSSIGIDPDMKFRFKRVKNSDEWDLDIEMKKKASVNVEEYFEVTPN